ncbi:addiction module protein [Trichlorobacter ammonificans]|uniref:Addiction module antitoxin RelB n=1 Tax=Trichlorobacter ammonificans TaxID=2916410 RepID=A0ABN8HIV8_9BACT|nr:addiction module protein [Trichlorobacter ammonificans]CAH2031167.1 Addiction module antitoxin RelB [Trichlorobacter ammonificans]
MGSALQIDKMSLAEKLEAMEMLWDDLTHHVQDVAMPEWHTEVLAVREADLSDGTARFDDWETAKENIRRALK